MAITQQSISTFLELQGAIKAEALRINNMLHEDVTDFAFEYEGLEPDYCGVDLDYLDFKIQYNKIILTYYVPYEDYTNTWTIPTRYIGLSDEEILAIAHKEWDNLAQTNREREIACLKRQADMFGYELKEKV
jgi:hypothetical protein